MQTSMRNAWPAFCKKWEGFINFMYLDTKRLVTFGLGNMIDTGKGPSDYGLTRPWRDKKTNALVRESRITAEFNLIKSHTELAPKGGGAFASVSTLKLADVDVNEAMWDTTTTYWGVLKRTLPDLDSWPADAQLAIMNMAWNLGPNFVANGSWPSFTKAAKARDFYNCAQHCKRAVDSDRDKYNQKLFYNSTKVWNVGGDVGKLWDADTKIPHPLGGLADTALSTIVVRSSKASHDSWYVQRMLTITGDYKSTLDGQFGPVSQAALNAWLKRSNRDKGITQANLSALSAATFDMKVNP